MTSPVLRWFLVFLAWCTTVIVPGLTFGDNLDGSWQASYDYFALNHFKAGTDYLFTYGPLGFLQTYVYNKDLFGIALVFQFLYRLFLLVEVLRIFAVCQVCVKRQNLFFLFLIVFLNLFASIINYSVFEFYNDFFLIVLVFACLVDDKRPLWRSAVAAIFCVIMVLGKANLFPLVLLAITLDTVRHRLQKRPFWSSPMAVFALGYAVLWFASGQSIQNFLPYLTGTLQIILGYNEAMAFDSPSSLSPWWIGAV